MSAVLQARSRLGVAARLGKTEDLAEARRDLAAAKLEAFVAKVVAEAPPLTEDQARRIAHILRGAA